MDKKSTPISEQSLLEFKWFARRQGLPEIPNPCPSAENSSRKEIKAFLAAFYAKNKKIRGNIFHALSHVRPDYLLPPT